MQISVEMTGGLETLFNNQKNIKLDLPIDSTIGNLLKHLEKYLVKSPELFTVNNTVRPGILVLVNDVDWELEGEVEYKLKENDRIVFISTLHGG